MKWRRTTDKHNDRKGTLGETENLNKYEKYTPDSKERGLIRLG